MTKNYIIRESETGDHAFIEALYSEAFPEENLVPLVKELLAEKSTVLSLVATLGSKLVGHAMFTRCGTGKEAALPGPLAVEPGQQRQGVGTELVIEGFEQLKNAGVRQFFVPGDPEYYSRFGFSPEREVATPYPLPPEWREAWQSKTIGTGEAGFQGDLSLPAVWLEPALWAP